MINNYEPNYIDSSIATDETSMQIVISILHSYEISYSDPERVTNSWNGIRANSHNHYHYLITITEESNGCEMIIQKFGDNELNKD